MIESALDAYVDPSMTVRTKLLVIVLFVGLVPLTVSAMMSLRLHQRAFDRQVEALHLQAAETSAALSAAYLEETAKTLSVLTAKTIDWSALDTAQRDSALWLVYRQYDVVLAASLLDDRGEGIGVSAYMEASAPIAELAAHPFATTEDLGKFGRELPLARALADGAAVGRPFLIASGDAALPIAIRTDATIAGRRVIVAVALSLRSLCDRVRDRERNGLKIALVDGSHRTLCRDASGTALSPIDAGLAAVSTSPGLTEYRDAAAIERVAARAELPGTGWSAVAHQPAEVAFAASRRLRLQSVLWIILSLVIAVAAGLLLARSITRPVKMLAAAASELGAGNFGARVDLRDRDELGALADAFNKMGGAIEERDREIRTWNDELVHRVDERTRELREAQGQLLESQKIGAVASLGAGIAHEINNPLAGILGFTQIMLASARRDPARENDAKILANVEAEAQRIRGIVKRVMELAETGQRGLEPVDLEDVVEGALRLVASRLAEARLEVAKAYAPNLRRVMGDADRLRQVVVQLLENAVIATAPGGVVTITTTSVEGELVKLEVGDTGRGIAAENLDKIFEPFFTTKDNWRGEGLGLTIAYRTITAHHGKLKATSTVGVGTTMTITLPAAHKGAHLE